MTDLDARELQDFRRELFGADSVVPTLYLAVVQSIADGADEAFGQAVAAGECHTFWLKETTLGVLSCSGAANESANITGGMYRLTDPVAVQLGVGKDYDEVSRAVRWWGRVATLRFSSGEPVVIDATRGSESQRRSAEQFIDAVLMQIAGG